MQNISNVLVALCCGVLIISCGSTPERPEFTATDQVRQFDPQSIVGKWNATILNALEGEQLDSAQYTFDEDGTWSSLVQNTSSGINIGVAGSGKWVVQGEEVIMTVEDTSIISSNPLAKAMGGMMKRVVEKTTGRINPYEISVDRIVWVSEHDQAMQLDRI